MQTASHGLRVWDVSCYVVRLLNPFSFFQVGECSGSAVDFSSRDSQLGFNLDWIKGSNSSRFYLV